MGNPPIIFVRESNLWGGFIVRLQPAPLSTEKADEAFMREFFEIFAGYVEWILTDRFTKELNYTRLSSAENIHYLLASFNLEWTIAFLLNHPDEGLIERIPLVRIRGFPLCFKNIVEMDAVEVSCFHFGFGKKIISIGNSEVPSHGSKSIWILDIKGENGDRWRIRGYESDGKVKIKEVANLLGLHEDLEGHLTVRKVADYIMILKPSLEGGCRVCGYHGPLMAMKEPAVCFRCILKLMEDKDVYEDLTRAICIRRLLSGS